MDLTQKIRNKLLINKEKRKKTKIQVREKWHLQNLDIEKA